jgi:hypothetical protein
MRATPSSRTLRDRPIVIYATLFVACYAIFALSKIVQMADSEYSMLLTQNLLANHSFDLRSSIPSRAAFAMPGILANGYPYQVSPIDGRVLYGFPYGSSILSIPFVAIMNLLGVSAVDQSGSYSYQGDKTIQRHLAAMLMAALTCVIFATARLLLPDSWSILVSLATAFGTSIWSTASRALWSHTWQTFLYGIVVYLLLRCERDRQRAKPVILATLLSWAYFTRPTSMFSIAPIAGYMLLFHRAQFTGYLTTGILWLAAFVTFSWIVFHHLLPGYYSNYLAPGFSLGRLCFSLAVNLFSPAHGLFFFSPILYVVIFLIARNWQLLPYRRLAILSLTIVALHLVCISIAGAQLIGMSFGPRHSTELIPWFALLAILGLAPMRAARESRPAVSSRRVGATLGLALLALSIAINARGALSGRANAGFDRYANNTMLWDWAHPQFMAGLIAAPR